MYRLRGCLFSLCLAIFLFWVSHATAGQVAGHVDCHKYGCFLHGLAINGEIDDTTLSELKGLFESFDRQRDPKIQSPDLSGTRINLNSPGGSVAAAMAVGRSLRANRITAYVEPHASCLSSCVLVFAGAVGRFGQNPLSKVGIHQPYFPVPNGRVDADEVRKAYAPMLSEIRDYLKEMNVSEQLAAEIDLPLNFHPAAIRVSAGFTPSGAGRATGDRRSWSGLRSRSPVAVRLAA
jgi:hypothetical protein